MINSKYIHLIVAVVVAIALIISTVLMVMGHSEVQRSPLPDEPAYATDVFGPDILSIEIIAEEDAWQTMLETARDEQYIRADVVVNGTRFQDVGVRAKGNSSLTQVASANSDRYSFRLQFDEYVKDQTCFGLESFVMNNMLGDHTYLKEYVSYELMREIGVETPYFGFADIRVNGKAWGLYLAVELYNKSYENRVFGDTSGMLYNVKSMDAGGKQPGLDNGDVAFTPDSRIDRPQMPDPNDTMPSRPDDPSAGRGSTGGSLEYTDDQSSSYSAIFTNVVGKGTEADFQRVIQALKALSAGEDLETYFDVDQILRYLAAHTIVVNLDSYSSTMAQNFYLYERSGQITVLPWDYNLAWGGFQSGNASSVINFPIDTPLSGVELESRPLIERLFENPEYLERYHLYLQQLVDQYFSDGQFEARIRALDSLLSGYVQNDATAFCTFEQYKIAIEAFIQLGTLRAQSVQGQLDGTIPSTTSGQNESPDQLIPADDLNLSDLGSMKGGKAGNTRDFPLERKG